MRWVLAILALLAAPGAALAGQFLHIVATGDSQTVGYAPVQLQNAMNSRGVAGNAYQVASGGATTSTYLGLVADQAKNPPVAHNFATQALNGPVLNASLATVNNPNADAIVVLIGGNDALQAANNPQSGLVEAFENNLITIANTYQAAITPQGKHPEIFFATVLPMLSNPNAPADAVANSLIDSTLNPFVRQTAATYGFHLIDVNVDIQQVPNWQSFYSEDGVNPGYIHLWLNGGYSWLANDILTGVLAATDSTIGIGRGGDPVQLPEPGAMALAATGVLALALRAARSRRSG